ncbi:MAG: hypothetical protein V3W22_06060 [Thermoplasmata archaeon]
MKILIERFKYEPSIKLASHPMRIGPEAMTPQKEHRKRDQVYVVWIAILLMAAVFLMMIPPA